MYLIYAVVFGLAMVATLAVMLELAGQNVSRMLVLGWVRLYTAGVPAAERNRRREEMAEHLATERGERDPGDPAIPQQPGASARDVLARAARTMWRLARGMWSDLAWATPLILDELGRRFDGRPPDPPARI
jgi:hypothetical protein